MTDYDYQRDWRKSQPRFPLLEPRSVLAIADGLTREPPRPYAYDCSRDLTEAEYMRIVNWRCRIRGWATFGLAEEPAA